MTLNFYTLGVLYLVYSFLGWVGETVVATFRGKRFANRGMAAGRVSQHRHRWRHAALLPRQIPADWQPVHDWRL